MATWTNTDRLRWLDVSRQLAADTSETPQVREKGRDDAVWWEQQIREHGGTVPPDPHQAAPPDGPARDRSYDLDPEVHGAAAGMLAVLGDPDEGVMRHLPPGSPQWVAAARVAGLYYRRIDHDEPDNEEWAAAAADAAGYEDDPDDYDHENDADGYNAACATRAVSEAVKAGADRDGAGVDDLTESALEWARECAGGARIDRLYDIAVEDGTEAEEEHRDSVRTAELKGRHATLTMASAGDGWDVDAHYPVGEEVEAIGWLRDHDMLDKRHHDPVTGETLPEWREGAHTTFTANDRGRLYLGAVAHELDQPVPAAAMQACPKCGRSCLFAPLDLDDPDEGDGPLYWHPVADPMAHQGVRMLLSCPKPEEPPADLTAPRTTGAPSASMPGFGNVTEAWQAMLDTPMPEDGAVEHLDAWFSGLAKVLGDLGEVLGETVGDWYGASPLAPRLLDHLAQVGADLRGLGGTAEGVLETWRVEHAEAIRRQREPRPGEGMLNTT